MKKLFSILAILIVVSMAGCKKDANFDEAAPLVKSTDPLNVATGQAINSKISATFDVVMDVSTLINGNFTVQKGTVSVPGTIAYAGTTATFTPTTNLESNTTYTALITKNVRNKNGKLMEKDFTWSFTTGATADVTLPTVTLTDPANNATGVSFDHLIKATFSKAMDPATITSLTFNLKQGSSNIAGIVTYTGTTATFTPGLNLSPGTTYTGTITTGAKDMTGKAIAGIYTFSFTTANAPNAVLPTISSTDPPDNASGIAFNKVISVTFSEALNPLTITTSTFSLKQGNTNVDGTVAYSGKTATFTPNAMLASGATYTATVTAGVKNLAGIALAADKVWSFTAKTVSMSGLTIVDLGRAGDYVILAKTKISNIPISAITGDLGLSPAATSYVTGFDLTNATGYATASQVTGKIYAADMVSPTSTNLTTAVENMITAYTDAAGRPTPDFLELGIGNIGGKTLIPGLYKWSTTVSMPSDVTISGGSNDVWIFQISKDLSMSNGVNIHLQGGAQARNIFWQVAGEATIGTTAHFEGIILSMTGITLKTGASFNGRALAQTAVILDSNTVTTP